jgi:hypothetical protein
MVGRRIKSTDMRGCDQFLFQFANKLSEPLLGKDLACLSASAVSQSTTQQAS